MDRTRSHQLFTEAQKHIPGGVNSPVRAFRGVGGTPVFFARAQGSYLYDVDGHRYLDYVGSWGPMILGHSHPAIIEAVTRAAQDGTSFGAPTEREGLFAAAIKRAVPSIEKLRLVSSGTEATMAALRVARGFTGRDVIVKIDGAYHGHADCLLVAAGSGAATLGLPGSAGVTAGTAADTLTVGWNDLAGMQQIFAAQQNGPAHKQIAAVIVEPVCGNMGCVAPAAGYLQGVRELCTQQGALLIFDEVMTGFRVARGGAQALYNIRPDLTCLGKIVGGGLPAAAYGGRADIMDKVAPLGPVYQAGTLSGNPLAVAAGLAMLALLDDETIYTQLEAYGAQLVEGLAQLAREAGVPVQLNRVGSMWTCFFSDQPVTDYATAKHADAARFARFFHAMLDAGVYLPPSQFEAAFNAATHDASALDQTLSAARAAFKQSTNAG